MIIILEWVGKIFKSLKADNSIHTNYSNRTNLVVNSILAGELN